MAENDNVYNEISRESCVYISAEIQGNLERKKKQGDVMETIDMQDVNHVRKIPGEYTGTHFEIGMKKKKNYVLICPSSENCTAWVNALQTAIERKNPSHQSSHKDDSMINDEDINVYSEVDEAFMPISGHSNSLPPEITSRFVPKLLEYAEPCDSESGAGKRDNDYWEIGDIRSNLAKLKLEQNSVYDNSESGTSSLCPANNKQISTVDKSSSNLSANHAYEDAKSNPAAKSSSNKDSSADEYAQVIKIKKTPTLPDVGEKTQTLNGPEKESHVKDLPSPDASFSSSANIHSESQQNFTSTGSEGGLPKIEVSNEDSELFQVLSEAFSEYTSPIEDYIHPLTEEDRKPLEELTDFLKINIDVCRMSYSSVSISNDPVSSLKSYLGSLETALSKLKKNMCAAEQLNQKSSTAVHNA